MPYATRSRTRDEAPQSAHVVEPQVPTSSKAGTSKSKDKLKKKAAQPAEVVTVKTAKLPAKSATAKVPAKDPNLSELRMPVSSVSSPSLVKAEEKNSQPKLGSTNTPPDDGKIGKTTMKQPQKDKVGEISSSDSDDEDLMQPVVEKVKSIKTTVPKKVDKKQIIKSKVEKTEVKDVKVSSESKDQDEVPASEGRQLRPKKPKA